VKSHLLLPLALLSALSLCAQRATVKGESAPVYSHLRISKDEIIKSLKRGDEVFVEFTSSSSEGEWCNIAKTSVTVAGYMLCADLKLERVVERSINISEEPTTPGTTGGAQTTPAPSEQQRPAKPRDEPSPSLHRVKYTVDGGGLAFLTYVNESGGTVQQIVQPPWTLVFYGPVGKFLYLSAQKQPIPWPPDCHRGGILRPDKCDELERLRLGSLLRLSTVIYIDSDSLPWRAAETNVPFGIATVSGSIR
jgi:hypothetical protein